MTYINCDICGYSEYEKIWISPPNVICKNCGFVYINPRGFKSAISKYYKDELLTSGKTFKEFKTGSRLYLLTKERSVFLKSSMQIKSGFILDIGCGGGEFLTTFNKKYWSRTGIDLTPEAIIKAFSYNLNVSTASVEDMIFPEDSFDVVCMISVLEHVYSPKVALEKVEKILKHGGYLFVEVPNVLKRSHGISELNTSEHLSHFSLNTLISLLRLTGFSVVCVDKKCSLPNIRLLAKKTNKSEKVKSKNEYKRIMTYLSQEPNRDIKFKDQLKRKLQILLSNEKRSVVIFGTGKHTIFLNSLFKLNGKNIYFVDSDPNKWGLFLFQKKIRPPHSIEKIIPKKIIISSRDFQDEIFQSIMMYEKLGIQIVKLYES